MRHPDLTMQAQDSKAGKISFFDERTVRWDPGKNSIIMIDQSALPLQLEFIECKTVEDTIAAIKTLKIRGAPAIGVCGAMGVALSVQKTNARTKTQLLRMIQEDCTALRFARPTAVNLSWGVDQVLEFIRRELPENLEGVDYKNKFVDFVEKLASEDVETNKKLSEFGSKLLRSGDSVLTHCN